MVSPLSNVSHKRIQSRQEDIRQFPATAKILLDPKGQPWPAGHHFVQKDLANTYRQLAEQGADYFYQGAFAHQVDRWMKANGGIVRYEDFKAYQLLQRKPVKSDYRGYTIYGFPPPSSGGVHVAQILNMLENFQLEKLSDGERYHVLAEAMPSGVCGPWPTIWVILTT